jgi:hypothetical protein
MLTVHPLALAVLVPVYDRNMVESVDLDASNIKIQRKIIHHAAKPM